jgi:hypothetical protein
MDGAKIGHASRLVCSLGVLVGLVGCARQWPPSRDWSQTWARRPQTILVGVTKPVLPEAQKA